MVLLILICFTESSSGLITESSTKNPWEYIAENVLQDLLSSFEDLRTKIMESQNPAQIRPIIFARFGKVLFRRLVLLFIFFVYLFKGKKTKKIVYIYLDQVN